MEDIDIPRLLTDLALTEDSICQFTLLDIPEDVRVASISSIKVGTVTDTLRIAYPSRNFNVMGVQAPSGVPEQPLGWQAIVGALNRQRNGVQAREMVAPGEAKRAAWFSVENGLFRVAARGALLGARNGRMDNVLLRTEGVDLSAEFDPEAEYEDRAVAAVTVPGYPTFVGVSPADEAVRFPKAAVLATYSAEGGFERHTVGETMHTMGIVRDRQNPHYELTQHRTGGALSRPDQMARVLLRCLVDLAG